MNLLSFDTSTEYLSIALQVQGKVTSSFELVGQSHSQLILPQIQALLVAADITLNDLDGIAFGAGPGSFTGVRIACGVAQGLGFGANLPVVGVNTLTAIAEASTVQKVIVCLDARMGEVYHAALQYQEGEWVEVLPTHLYKPQGVPVIEGLDWVGVGSGWQTYADVLSARYHPHLQNILPKVTPTGEAILKLAQPVFEAGLATAASEATPLYIRNRVALTTQERAQGMRL